MVDLLIHVTDVHHKDYVMNWNGLDENCFLVSLPYQSDSYSKHEWSIIFPFIWARLSSSGLTRLFMNIVFPKWTFLGPVQDLQPRQREVEQKLRPVLFTFNNLNYCPKCTSCLPVLVLWNAAFWNTRDQGNLNQLKIGISTSDGFSFNAATTAVFLATELCGGLDQDKWRGVW